MKHPSTASGHPPAAIVAAAPTARAVPEPTRRAKSDHCDDDATGAAPAAAAAAAPLPSEVEAVATQRAGWGGREGRGEGRAARGSDGTRAVLSVGAGGRGRAAPAASIVCRGERV